MAENRKKKAKEVDQWNTINRNYLLIGQVKIFQWPIFHSDSEGFHQGTSLR